MKNVIGKYVKSLFIRFASPNKRAELLKKAGVRLGSECEIYEGVTFGSEPFLIDIGDKVRITKNVTFITHDGGMWVLRNNGMLPLADSFGRIKIGNNVHIGINAVIMPGVTIGNNVVIGVGSVVTSSIPSNSVAVGIPARVIKSVEAYCDQHKSTVDFTKNMNQNEKKDYLINKYNIQS